MVLHIFPFTFILLIFFHFFVFVFWQVTSLFGPIPRNPFQTGKFFHEFSAFVGHNPGMFKIEQLRLTLG